jgi:hypothetical protein
MAAHVAFVYLCLFVECCIHFSKKSSTYVAKFQIMIRLSVFLRVRERETEKVNFSHCGSLIADDIAVSKCSSPSLSVLPVDPVLVSLYDDIYRNVVVMLLRHVLLVYHILHILFLSFCLDAISIFSYF